MFDVLTVDVRACCEFIDVSLAFFYMYYSVLQTPMAFRFVYVKECG